MVQRAGRHFNQKSDLVMQENMLIRYFDQERNKGGQHKKQVSGQSYKGNKQLKKTRQKIGSNQMYQVYQPQASASQPLLHPYQARPVVTEPAGGFQYVQPHYQANTGYIEEEDDEQLPVEALNYKAGAFNYEKKMRQGGMRQRGSSKQHYRPGPNVPMQTQPHFQFNNFSMIQPTQIQRAQFFAPQPDYDEEEDEDPSLLPQ